jgi:hypothetical protein
MDTTNIKFCQNLQLVLEMEHMGKHKQINKWSHYPLWNMHKK